MAAGSELDEAFNLSAADEAKLVVQILKDGWDQGCFVAADKLGEEIVVREWLDKMETRARLTRHLPVSEDDSRPPKHEPPEADDGFLVLTQRCDLIKDLQREPIVELARCVKSDKSRTMEAEKNSARFILAYRSEGEDEGWVVDLCDKISIPKTRLPHLGKPQLILPDSERERTRFALRLGRRHSRKPLPTMFVKPIQQKLRSLLKGEMLERAKDFSEWLLTSDNPQLIPTVVAVLVPEHPPEEVAGREETRRRNEDTLRDLLDGLDDSVDELINRDAARVMYRDEITLGDYLDAYPIDLEEVTLAAAKRTTRAIARGDDPPGEHAAPSV